MTAPIPFRDLEGEFITRTADGFRIVCPKADAEGVYFLCPKCFEANGGKRGTHAIVCWGPDVPLDVEPGPGRWTLDGAGLDDLTLNGALGKTRSVQLNGGCAWHGFVTDGMAHN